MPTVKVELTTQAEATAERLWDLVADVKAWPEWQGTSYVDPPAGPLQKGSTFAAELGGHTWNVTVTEADRPRRLVWAGRQPGFGIVFMRSMLEKKVSEHDGKWLANLKAKAKNGLA
jgi:hypothetical protein